MSRGTSLSVLATRYQTQGVAGRLADEVPPSFSGQAVRLALVRQCVLLRVVALALSSWARSRVR